MLTLKSTEIKDFQLKIGSMKLKDKIKMENLNLLSCISTTNKKKTNNFIKSSRLILFINFSLILKSLLRKLYALEPRVLFPKHLKFCYKLMIKWVILYTELRNNIHSGTKNLLLLEVCHPQEDLKELWQVL